MPALAAALLIVAGASGSYDAALAKAVALYNEAEWDAALRELTIAEKLASDDGQRVTIWLHQGIMLANVPDADAARAAWRRALELEPQSELPLPVSPRVRALFQEVQKSVRDAPTKPSLVPAENRGGAPQQAVEEPSSFPVIPLIALGAGLAAGGVGLGFALGASSQFSAAQRTTDPAQSEALRARATTQATIGNIAFAVAGAAALIALITFIVLD